MFGYFLIAAAGFLVGFLVASLVVAAKQQDHRWAVGVLYEAVHRFTEGCDRRGIDASGNLVVARDEIDDLKQALKRSDDLEV